jgi:uncharacterized protein YodC (DUF2158 family)
MMRKLKSMLRAFSFALPWLESRIPICFDVYSPPHHLWEEAGMPADSIKVGILVEPKSGGPTMTVDAIDPKGYAVCSWLEHGKPQQRSFPLTSLHRAGIALESRDEKSPGR